MQKEIKTNIERQIQRTQILTNDYYWHIGDLNIEENTGFYLEQVDKNYLYLAKEEYTRFY